MPTFLLGLPGCGKSTLFRQLLNSPGTIGMHPGRHAVDAGLVTSTHPSRGELLAVETQLTDSFLQALSVAILSGAVVIVDGFPRTEQQAQKLFDMGWELKVFHLVFPAGRETELSVERQAQRMRSEGLTPDLDSLADQCRLGMLHDETAIRRLKDLGVQVVEIDAMLAPEDVLSLVVSSGFSGALPPA